MLNNYAYFLAVRKEQLAKAEKMSGAALQYDPNNISFLDTYAWVFFVQENFVMAELYIKQAVDKGGADNEVIAEHYGDILSKIGK
jgi:Tfp pilus assembly protein PilF